MSSDDLDGMTVLDFTTNGDSFHLRDQGGEVVHEYQAAEPSTQRPWAAVVPSSPEGPGLRARYAAMALAHWRALGRVNPTDDEAYRQSFERHVHPMLAAFTAAAALTGWSAYEIHQAVEEDDAQIPDRCCRWLTAASIDPAEIAPAS